MKENVIESTRRIIIIESIEQDQRNVQNKMAQAQAHLDAARKLMSEVGQDVNSAAQKAGSIGAQPKVSPSEVQQKASSIQQDINQLCFSVGRMIGLVILFFGGLLAGGKIAQRR